MMKRFNENLRKFRREKGITQEQLAERVGVSPQAVSKWERSSYPDAALLPLIAAALGVTIDELYGGERSEEIDLKDRVMRYFSELPREAVFSEITALCHAFVMACCGAGKYAPAKDGFPREKGTDTYSRLDRRDGFYLERLNDDLPFVWILPRPAEGAAMDDVLAYDPEMVGLFRFLAMPDALRAMYFLTGRTGSMFFNRKTLVNELTIPEENADRIIEGMFSLGLIWCAELNSGENGEKIYQYVADCYFVSFLVMARTLLRLPCNFDYSNHEPRGSFFTRDSYRKISDEAAERQSCHKE